MLINFTINLEIFDEDQLRTAAEERAVADGLNLNDWRNTRTGPNDDLVMLLDPGSIPGCSINYSTTDNVGDL